LALAPPGVLGSAEEIEIALLNWAMMA